MSAEWAVVIVFASAGITWLGSLISWCKEFGTSTEEILNGSAWGVLGALIFPVIWLGVATVGVVRLAQWVGGRR